VGLLADFGRDKSGINDLVGDWNGVFIGDTGVNSSSFSVSPSVSIVILLKSIVFAREEIRRSVDPLRDELPDLNKGDEGGLEEILSRPMRSGFFFIFTSLHTLSKNFRSYTHNFLW
jgi:hypothetical protein